MSATLSQNSRTSRVQHVREGSVAFSELSSWYDFPPHMEPLFRTAKETGREVTFTTDIYNVLSAELAPLPPSPLDRSRTIAALLWARLTQRQ